MPSVSKLILPVVVVCLLLPWASGGPRSLFGHRHDNRIRRERHPATFLLRRSRKEHPAHHPVRLRTKTAMPPEEDDHSRSRLVRAHTRGIPAILRAEPAGIPCYPSRSPQQSLPDDPLYSTLRVLLI
jgi:hypothetical protein